MKGHPSTSLKVLVVNLLDLFALADHKLAFFAKPLLFDMVFRLLSFEMVTSRSLLYQIRSVHNV